MNFLQALSLMSALMPIIVNFEALKQAKTTKTKKAALKEITVKVMEIIDDLTPLRIMDRKKFALAVEALINTLEFEETN